MRIATNGIVFNEYTKVLLMQRDDTRTWAIPGGMLNAGELPTEGVAREVREETGILVMPVRLVGVYHLTNLERGSSLLFAFRCIQRGGEIETSHESPQVGWFPTRPLPGFMLDMHRQRILDAFAHQGGPPILARQRLTLLHRLGFFFIRHFYYRYKDWRRLQRGEPPYQEPPGWQTAVTIILRNEAEEVLWLKEAGQAAFRLPGGDVPEKEAPWETAVAIIARTLGLSSKITHLSGVYAREGQNHLTLTFTARATGGFLHPPTGTEYAYFAPGAEPEACLPAHLAQVQDAQAPGYSTQFRRLAA